MTTPRSHGPWQILSRREVYRDPWIEVTRDEVIRPDGAPGTHAIVRLKPGVTVLAVDDAQTAYLTEEFHYAVGRETIEAVSGGIDGDEAADQAARRELAEELGITAAEWTDLGTCDPFTSVVTSPTRLFLARRLSFGRAELEGSESVRMRALPLAEAVDMVLDGRITHAPTCLAILKARLLLERQG
jgi:ADP-ribose pyrophosphatase